MNLSINPLSNNNLKYNHTFRGVHNITNPSHYNFRDSVRTHKLTWMIFLLSSLLALTSCKNRNQESDKTDNIEFQDRQITKANASVEKTDSGDVKVTEFIFNDRTYSKTYYNMHNRIIMHEYNDKDNKISKNRYYDDGSKTLETKMPNGEKTLVKDDSKGHIISTTKYPNGEKLVVEDIHNQQEDTHTETKYYINNKVHFRYYKKENVMGDSVNNVFSYEIYDRKGNLLYWSNNSVEQDSANVVHDDLGRLIYNENSNTTYEYNENDSLPSKEITEKDGCKHIKIYENGEIKSDYFESKNGIITPIDSVNSDIKGFIK